MYIFLFHTKVFTICAIILLQIGVEVFINVVVGTEHTQALITPKTCI